MTGMAISSENKLASKEKAGLAACLPRVTAREATRQLTSTRTWVLALLPGLAAVAITVLVAIYGGTKSEVVGTGFALHPSSSGFAYPFIAINTERYFILPLVVAMFAGEAIAGEAYWGSLRYLLACPVSRKRLFATKTAVSATQALVAIALLPIMALAVGIVLSSANSLQVLDIGTPSTLFYGTQTSFGHVQALAALAGGTGLVAVSMLSTFSFATFLSTLTNEPFIPVAGGVGLLMVSRAIANIPGLSAVTPLLPTAYGIHWADVLSAGGPGGTVLDMFAVQAVWCIVLLSLAVWRFTTRDMLW